MIFKISVKFDDFFMVIFHYLAKIIDFWSYGKNKDFSNFWHKSWFLKGEIIEKSLKVYFAANPHFLWKHFVFDDFGITGGISK